MLVSDVMTTEVVSVSEDAPLKEAARLLVEHRVSGLPVTNTSGKVLGIISEADFVTTADQQGSLRKLFLRLFVGSDNSTGPVRGSVVRDAMTTPARTIAPDRSIAHAARLMGKWKVNRLPVEQDGRMIGIITRADIVGTYTRSDAVLLQAITTALEPFEGVTALEVVDGVAVIGGHVKFEAIAEAARSQVASVAGILQVDARKLTWDTAYRQ